MGSDVGYSPGDGMTFEDLRRELSRQDELERWEDWTGPSNGWPLRGKWCPTLQGTFWTAMDGTPFPLKRWRERVRDDCRHLNWDGDWDGRLDGPLYALAVRVELDLGVSVVLSSPILFLVPIGLFLNVSTFLFFSSTVPY